LGLGKIGYRQTARSRRCLRMRGALAGLLLAIAPVAAAADPLVMGIAGAPTQVGAGQGKRALWASAGMVGAQPVDLVATLTTAALNHNFTTTADRPSITSVGQDNIWVQWRIFQAGTYDINTDSGGVPVPADVHVQLNDIDGPNNERAFLPVCDGTARWVRIDEAATTGRDFGTVAGVPEIFSLIGDQSYNSEPQSGVEVLYPNTSTFVFGRTANNNFFIRVDNPSYSTFNTIDYQCGDLTSPTAVDDVGEGTAGDPVVIAILDNDSIVTDNPSGEASEYGLQSVNLATPGGAGGVLTDAGGDVYQFTVPGQGTWNYNESTGDLTFTPQPGFTGTVTPITYTFDNALGVTSNAAAVSIEYPGIGIVKAATLNDNVHADGHAQVGETIGYTYSVTVIGGISLQAVAVTETGFGGAGVAPVPAYQSGDVNANNRLDPGETWVYTASYTLVAADVAAGSVSNQATAEATSMGGNPVSDLSDSTNPADGNGVGTPGPGAGNDDATVSVLSAAPIDAVDDAPPAVGGIAGEANVVDVLANDELDGAVAALARVTISVVTPAGHGGVSLNTATGVVSVAPSTPSGGYSIVYRICETLNPTNCDDATVTVTVDAGAIVATDDTVPGTVDTANALTGVVNVLANDTLEGAAATVANVNVSPDGAMPAGFTLTMQGAVDIAQGTSSGTYSFDYRICEILNPANCDSATVTITVQKSVPSIAGTVFFDANGNGAFDTSEKRLPGYRVELRQNRNLVRDTTSAADGSYHIFDFNPGAGYEVVFIDPVSGVAVGHIANLTFAINQAMANQNQPIDPSGVVYNAITGAPLSGAVMELRSAGNVRLPDACLLAGQQGQTTGADGRYRFDVVPGAHALCPAAETQYLLAFTTFPGGVEPTLSELSPPQPGALDATTCPMDAVPGGACQLSASFDAPPAGTYTPYFMAFLLAPGDPNVVNNHIPLDPLPSIPANGLSVTKRASVATARRDDVVGYVIVAGNDNGFAAGPLDVVDRLPPGFAYVAGSARVGGTAVAPVQTGRTLTFRGLRIPARGRVEIRLSARIGADVVPGELANEAWMTNPATGEVLTAVARAVVRVVAEHVFDCADVTGKVFDDRNRDGWQDSGEKGLPAVRIATVNGVLITTDRHGRFSVPCAALPDQSIGSNFILKLDPRTLPGGYAVTTENPRVVRLTAGKAATVDFGATAGRVIDIQINGRAFTGGGAHPSPELHGGIGQLAAIGDKRAAILTVTYRAGGEARGLRQARVDAVRGLLAEVWRDGRKALPFEIRVVGE
jgi:uncharacterized repeat protein (TIGR01451 family)